MQIHHISGLSVKTNLVELGYSFYKVPSVGTCVTCDERPGKEYIITSVRIVMTDDEISGFADIAELDQDGEIRGETHEMVEISTLTVL